MRGQFTASRGYRLLARLALAGALVMAAQPTVSVGNGWEHFAISAADLLVALKHENAEVRARAAVSLGVRRENQAVAPLLAVLARPELARIVRREIYTALGHIGDSRAADALQKALVGEAREELRAEAAEALGRLGHPPTLSALLAALHDDPELTVRARIVDALGGFDQPPAVDALVALLRGQDDTLRPRAVRSLGATGSPAAVRPLLRALALETDERARRDIVDALGRIGHPAAAQALAELLRETQPPLLRLHLTVALASIREARTTPVLLGLLHDSDPAVQRFALEGLRLNRAVEAVPQLNALFDRLSRGIASRTTDAALAEPEETLDALVMQERIIRALLEIDPAGGVSSFMQGARVHSYPRDSSNGLRLLEAVYLRRRIALSALGYTGHPDAARFIRDGGALTDPDSRLRSSAIRALGVLGRPDAVATVIPLLGDANADVRREAAMVLGRLKDSRAVGPLIVSLSDVHALVRQEAALSLGYLHARGVRERLSQLARTDGSERVRAAASQALALLDAR